MPQNFLFVLAFLPYLGIRQFGTDTQPWALLFALGLLGVFVSASGGEDRISKPWLVLVWSSLFGLASAMVMLVMDGVGGLTGAMRSLASIWSPLIVSAAVIALGRPPAVKVFYLVVGIWFVVGFAQVLVPGGFDVPFLVRSWTGGGRGVTSLAPEPVWYSRVQILLMLTATLLHHVGRIRKGSLLAVHALGVLQIVVFSLAGLGYIYLAGYLILYAVVVQSGGRRVCAVVLSIALLVGVLAVGIRIAPEKRVFNLAQTAYSNVVELWKYAGVRYRVLNPVVGVYVGLVHTRGLGVGVGASATAADLPEWFERLRYSGGSEVVEQGQIGGRIRGGFPSVIYEMGVSGVAWLIGFFGVLRSAFRTSPRAFRPAVGFSAGVLVMVLLFESTLANPMIGYVLGLTVLLSRMPAQPDI